MINNMLNKTSKHWYMELYFVLPAFQPACFPLNSFVGMAQKAEMLLLFFLIKLMSLKTSVLITFRKMSN